MRGSLCFFMHTPLTTFNNLLYCIYVCNGEHLICFKGKSVYIAIYVIITCIICNYCILHIKEYNSSITATMCQGGSYRTLAG